MSQEYKNRQDKPLAPRYRAKVKTVYCGNHVTEYTGLETCEGCGNLHSDQIIPCHELMLCPTCQERGTFVACCGCDATINVVDGEAVRVAWCHNRKSKVLSPVKNEYMCDACNEYDSQPFEMDWNSN
jgi:hypothetical protein